MTAPQDRPTFEQLAGDGKPRRRACPNCGERDFAVTSVWTLKDGKRRRSLHCRACGHVANSIEEYDE